MAIYIKSTVSDPQKEQEGQNAYVSYLITTNSNAKTFQKESFSVRRRYSDFFFLYNTLFNEYPACLVPPLSEKAVFEFINRFDYDFVTKRAASLNRFLERISKHPILQKATVYLEFLESNDWNAFKRAIGTKNIPVAISSTDESATSLNNDDEFLLDDIKEKISTFEDNLTQVEKTFNKVLKRENELSTDVDDLSAQFLKFSTIETNLKNELELFSTKNHDLSLNISSLRNETDTNYITSLKDMLQYASALKALLKLREQKINDFDSLVNQLNKAESDKQAGDNSNFLRDKIENVRGVDREHAKQERLKKLETKIANLQDQINVETQNVKDFKAISLHEISIFNEIKKTELKSTLSDLAQNHINFYQNLINNWEMLL